LSFGTIVGLFGVIFYLTDVIVHWLCQYFSPEDETDIKRDFDKDSYHQDGVCNFGNHTYRHEGKMHPQYDLYDIQDRET